MAYRIAAHAADLAKGHPRAQVLTGSVLPSRHICGLDATVLGLLYR